MSRNRLADETSPYLLQHADNPVHWWAWGDAALAEAKTTGKPILLSVGYAACHWCHVMAHESFEDAATADVMNELFVNIKVDREERPDIDAIYMGALHALGEQGGWPLTMFLNPEAEPFWGGTYFPKQQSYGRPSFVHVLKEVSRIHKDEAGKVASNAMALKAHLTAKTHLPDAPDVTPDLLRDIAGKLAGACDPKYGGIQGAPKFPQFSFFWLLWRAGLQLDVPEARAAVLQTLRGVCQGGIYDHLGGGFARYSVDDRWLVPHFEKMLYDNALLIELLTDAWRDTQDPLFARRIDETVDWLAREMVTAEGGFAASLDADTEGEEGKFYVWQAEEVLDVLGPQDFGVFAEAYDVTSAGNWEGKTVLNRLHRLVDDADDDEDLRERLADMRQRLWRHREDRVRPGLDDKVLADWNGLMIAALARAGRVFGRDDYVVMAKRAFDAVVSNQMDDETGRLKHSYREGQAKAAGTASDYANMIWAALRLHEAAAFDHLGAENDSHETFLPQARRWQAVLDQHFLTDDGGYAQSADDVTDVIVRLVNARDDATPNANAVTLSNLTHLQMLTGEPVYRDRATSLVAAFQADVARALTGHTGLLAAAFDLLHPVQVVVCHAGERTTRGPLAEALNSIASAGALEQLVSAGAEVPPDSPLAGKTDVSKSTLYACGGPQCSLPVTTGDAVRDTVRTASSIR